MAEFAAAVCNDAQECSSSSSSGSGSSSKDFRLCKAQVVAGADYFIASVSNVSSRLRQQRIARTTRMLRLAAPLVTRTRWFRSGFHHVLLLQRRRAKENCLQYYRGCVRASTMWHTSLV
jgi:hypothetical protein